MGKVKTGQKHDNGTFKLQSLFPYDEFRVSQFRVSQQSDLYSANIQRILEELKVHLNTERVKIHLVTL